MFMNSRNSRDSRRRPPSCSSGGERERLHALNKDLTNAASRGTLPHRGHDGLLRKRKSHVVAAHGDRRREATQKVGSAGKILKKTTIDNGNSDFA